ncbi:MAG: aquaporin family protein [Marinilabiliales bacterium]|nr:MAG: aquaporin family protein [Marinilabiliales bacterium]
MDTIYLYEFIGTAVLVLMGDGVVANSVLKDTKSHGAGWVVITFGWGLGVFLGVIIAAPHSGAHINPAVTLGFAFAGMFDWSFVPGYIIAQLLGGFAGATVVYIYFRQHFDITEDKGTKLSVFCTGPQIRSFPNNVFSEVAGTFVLIFTIFHFADPSFTTPALGEVPVGLGSVGALPVALLVVGIGMSLGGTTGYAINPARDLGPRFAHYIFPMRNKGGSDWGYSWVPVFAPILGAFIAAMAFVAIW